MGKRRANFIGYYRVFLINSAVFLVYLISFANAQDIYRRIPEKPDKSKQYIFYLHGRIIEEQGIRPTHNRFGVYEYEKILQTLADSGFVVISEARKKNTNPMEYAQKVVAQVDSLILMGISPANITVIGASKGAAIAVLVSDLLKKETVHFVVMAICNSSMASYWEKNNVHLWGRVLYIHDKSDGIAGSCQPYMKFLQSKGLKEYKEIELNLGLGHGFLYKPYKEWIVPAVEWTRH